MKLHVITACSRPENLHLLWCSLQGLTHFDWRWLVVCDRHHVHECHFVAPRTRVSFVETDGPDPGGNPAKQRGLELSGDGGLLYWLDDDNLIHPRLDEALYRALLSDPGKDIYVFGQEHPRAGFLRPAGPLAHCLVDQAQYVVRKTCVGAARFPMGVQWGDWLFLEQLLNSGAAAHLSPETATYYNALTPDGRPQQLP